MNLFGTELTAQQLMALVGLVATLVLWLFVLRGQRGYARWFKQWEADRKAKAEAELAQGQPPAASKTDQPKSHGGPWG